MPEDPKELKEIDSFVKQLGLAKQHYPINGRDDLHIKGGGKDKDKVLKLMGQSIPVSEITSSVPSDYFPIADEKDLKEKTEAFIRTLSRDGKGAPKRPLRLRKRHK